MNFDLNDVLNATGGGVQIISQQHDTNKITWQNGVKDLLEMGGQTGIAAGLRRAGLNISRGKVSLMSVLEVPWMGLGVVVDRCTNGAETLFHSNTGGWDLTKIRQQYEFCGNLFPTNTYSVVRQDTGESVGEVGAGYSIFHNENCIEVMDVLFENGAMFETAGALGKGEKVWYLAKLPEPISIRGDEVQKYCLIMNSHDGSSKINIFPTSDRVVCRNTLRLAYDKRRNGIAVKHTKNAKDRIADAKKALVLTKRDFDRFSEEANILAGVQMQPEEFFQVALDDILDVTILDQKVTSTNSRGVIDAILNVQDREVQITAKKQLDRVLEKRKNLFVDIMNRYESERNNGNAAIAGTAWAAVNAVTEAIDHGSVYRFNGNPQQKRESAFESAIYGKADETKAMVFNMALAATR